MGNDTRLNGFLYLESKIYFGGKMESKCSNVRIWMMGKKNDGKCRVRPTHHFIDKEIDGAKDALYAR
jgi:hypothetical protein